MNVAAFVGLQLSPDRSAAPSASPGTSFLTVPAVDGHRRTAGSVVVAYRDVAAFARPTRGKPVPVVLLHGSPGRGRVFEGLVDLLAGPRRILVPDLPGFGASSPTIPDYSFAAHAAYVHALLDRLDVPRVHLVGFSLGGGVALSMVGRRETRVASLTLLSSIGVQEMELLGQYHVNHLLHGIQVAAVWSLIRLSPRSAALSGPWSYARNFYDSDQRPCGRRSPASTCRRSSCTAGTTPWCR